MDVLIKNATVYTLNGENDPVEAIGITGNRISQIGRTDELIEYVSDTTLVIDGKDLTAIPGFIDSHTHFLDMGVKKVLYLDLEEASSKSELLELLDSYARDNPDRTWILGNNWDESTWKGDGSFPTKWELNEVVSDRPVALQRVDCHTYCVNSKALELLDLDPSTRGAETSSGELTGCLSEDAALAVSKEIAPTRDEMVKGLKEAQKEAHSLGVTGIHQMVIDDGEFRDYFNAYQSLLQRGDLNLRCRLYFTGNYLDDFLNLGIKTGFGNDRLKIGGLKIFTDGSIGSKTAWISDGYRDNSDNTGISMMETEKLKNLVARAHKNNIQVAIHAIGDRAMTQAIDSLQTAINSHDIPDYVPPHRIEHCEMATDGQIERMAELGIIASMQPNFTGKWGLPGGMYEDRFDRDKLSELNMLGRFQDQGVQLSFGSDGMPFGPLYGLHWAVNSPFESQKLSPKEALKAYTSGSAYAGGLEGKVGSIEVGKYADIALLNGDPVENPDLIKDLEVELTIVGGDIVFTRKEY
ncbi:MAG: amidohydrolase [Candidatus Bipolaricaulota bacterium]|nr:amidohydrolase [Candidatus Bipolaricaulota bacterium]